MPLETTAAKFARTLKFDSSGQCAEGRLLNALTLQGLDAAGLDYEIESYGVVPVALIIRVGDERVKLTFDWEVLEDDELEIASAAADALGDNDGDVAPSDQFPAPYHHYRAV